MTQNSWIRLNKAAIVLILLFVSIVNASMVSADTGKKEQYLQQAEALKSLGIFQGTSNGFELTRKPSRVEGAVMLLRLLGKEDAANEQKNKHPFKDVPQWADAAIGYMFVNHLTSGLTATTFGSNNDLSASQYATFILRTLGYDDLAGDFQWNQSIAKLAELGIIKSEQEDQLNSTVFLRDHVALLSFNSLKAFMKHGEKKLAETLIDNGTIAEAVAQSTGIAPVQIKPVVNQKGITFLHNTYGGVHLVVRSNELEGNLSQYARLAIQSYDNQVQYEEALKSLEANTFDYEAFLTNSTIKTEDLNQVKLYKHSLIKGGYSRNGTDPQTTFYCLVIFYNEFQVPIAYTANQLALYEDMIQSGRMNTDDEKVQLAPQQQIFKGIEIAKTGEHVIPGGLIVNDYKLTEKISELNLEAGVYYDTLIYDDKPLELLKYGVPKRNLTPISPLGSRLPFSMSDTIKYYAVIIFDERSNIVAFYESETEIK